MFPLRRVMENIKRRTKPINRFGLKVEIFFLEDGAFMGDQRVLRNVTRIHYNFLLMLAKAPSLQVAFESDIHGTRDAFYIGDIHEFEATLETEIAEGF